MSDRRYLLCSHLGYLADRTMGGRKAKWVAVRWRARWMTWGALRRLKGELPRRCWVEII